MRPARTAPRSANNSNGTFNYDPNGAAFFETLPVGTASRRYSFTYTVTDNHGVSSTAVATITVTSPIAARLAVHDTGSTNANVVLTTTAATGVLANDSADDSGDSLHVSGVTGGTVGTQFTLASGAKLTLSSDGHYSYDPTSSASFQTLAVGTTAIDTFTYTVTDNHGVSATATDTITIHGEAPAGIGFALPGSFATIDNSSKLNGTIGTFTETGGNGSDTFTYSGSASGLSVSSAGVLTATNISGSTSGTVIALAVTATDTTTNAHTTVTYDVVVGTDGPDTITVPNVASIVYGLKIGNNNTDTITANGNTAPVWIVDGGNNLSGGGNSGTHAVLTGGSVGDVIRAPGTAANDVGSTTITGGGGADTMIGNGSATSNTYVINSGQSLATVGGSGNAGTISHYDIITNFSTSADFLNLQGTPAAATTATFPSAGSIDSTLTIAGATVKSHSITNGIITFDTSSETFSSAVSLNATDTSRVAAAVQYLESNDIGSAGQTVAFIATINGTAHTYIYEQVGNTPNSANDILVELQGVTLGNLSTFISGGHLLPAGVAGSPINLALNDPTGAGAVTTLTVAGVPADWSLNAGTNNGNGTWTVQTSDPASLTVMTPAGFSGASLLDVTESWTNADGSTGIASLKDNVEAYAPGGPIFAVSGDDALTGAGANDEFVFAQSIGNDTIYNFNVASDQIDLVGFNNFASFSAIQANLTDDGNGNALITIGGGETITLNGIAASSINANDFVFDQTPITENASSMLISDGAVLPLSGVVDNTGTIALNSTGDETDLELIQHGITLQGGGALTLSDSGANAIVGTDPSVILTNVDNIISGAGQLGEGQMTLVNDGTIDATGINALVLDTGSNVITNSGTLEATGSGGLIVNSAIDNSGNLLADGGNITFNGAVTGNGTATISGAATIEFAAASAETVNFAAGSTGTLKLDDSAAFTGSVSGLTTTTYIDFADLAWEQGQMTASFSGDISGGKLTVSDGNQSDVINLAGDYTQSGWTLSQDSNGKTLVVDPPLNSGSNVIGTGDKSTMLLAQYAAAGFQSGLGGGAGAYATMPPTQTMLGEAPPLTKPTA